MVLFSYQNGGNHRIRKIDPSGIVTTYAGTGQTNCLGDGGPAIQACLDNPVDIRIDSEDALYIADSGHHRIRKITSNGIISTVAGTGQLGFTGDNGPADLATLDNPNALALDDEGNIFISDFGNHVIRKIAKSGKINTIAGNGSSSIGSSNVAALSTGLGSVYGLAVGNDGSLYINAAEGAPIPTIIKTRRVWPDGIIRNFAGLLTGEGGDGGSATSADFNGASGVAVGEDSSVYISDEKRIRVVSPTNIISSFTDITPLGSSLLFGGGGALSTQVAVATPGRLTSHSDGALYFATLHHRIFRFKPILPGFKTIPFSISSKDGSLLYNFTPSGRHISTANSLTGALIYQFGYNSQGHIHTVTDGDGNITTITYDANGIPKSIVAPFGQITTLEVNSNGYLSKIINPNSESYQFSYSADGLLQTMKDPRENLFQFSYNALGRLLLDSDPEGGSQALARLTTPSSYEVTRTSGLNRKTKYFLEYTPTGDIHRKITSPDGAILDQTKVTGGDRTTNYSDGTITYIREEPDPRFGMLSPIPSSIRVKVPSLEFQAGVKKSVVLANSADPLSVITTTDELTINDKVFTDVFNKANLSSLFATPMGKTITRKGDPQGRITELSILPFEPTFYSYDSFGRIDKITQGSGTSKRETDYQYNTQGYLGQLVNPLNQITSFLYDPFGRIEQVTYPDGQLLKLSYDPSGNLVSLKPPGKTEHKFEYTTINNQSKYNPPITIPPLVGAPGGPAPTYATTYSYNIDRQLELVTRPDGEAIDFVYDSVTGKLNSEISPEGVLSYQYDPVTKKLSSITAPNGAIVSYGYQGFLLKDTTWSGGLISGSVNRVFDNFFRVSSLKVNNANEILFGYDNDGFLTSAGTETISRSVQNGTLTATMLGNTTDSYLYNTFGETEDYVAKFSTTQLFGSHYIRDKLGRITTKSEVIGGVSKVFNYTYDGRGRLTEVKLNGTPVSIYTYDTNGNRLSHRGSHGVANGTYDPQDRLIQYGGYTYFYTPNGELKEKRAGSQSTTYDYDVYGNLRTVTLPSGTTIEYVIDSTNRRIGKKVNGSLVQSFLYQDKLRPIAELDAASQVISRFVYGSKGNVPDYLIKSGTTYRIFSDHLGSPRLVINTTTGAIIQRLDYDEFGNIILDTNPGFQPFGFAGGLYDLDTKLTRFGARDYDAAIARWTAKDPIGFMGNDANLYAYTLSDPVNFYDVSGTISVTNNLPYPVSASGNPGPGQGTGTQVPFNISPGQTVNHWNPAQNPTGGAPITDVDYVNPQGGPVDNSGPESPDKLGGNDIFPHYDLEPKSGSCGPGYEGEANLGMGGTLGNIISNRGLGGLH